MKRRLPALINFLLLLAIAATATYWILQFTARRTPPEQVVAVPPGNRMSRTQPVDMSGVASLFGASGAAASPARLRLAGVIAEGGRGSGVALLSIDGQPAVAYRAGEPMDDQMTLAEVHADRVIVTMPGGNQDIRLPEQAAPDGIARVP
jgi:general secretion pathway protein C